MSELLKSSPEVAPSFPDLSNFSITIANELLHISPLVKVDILQLPPEIEFFEQIQEKVRHELSIGKIIAINNEAQGVVVGLQQKDEGLKVGVTKRYEFGPHHALYDYIPQGEVAVAFDESGKCKVAIVEDEEEAFSITSPSTKTRSQDRFSILSGRMMENTYVSEEDFEGKTYKTSRYVTDIQPILVESLANNSEPWNSINRDVRLGQWLIKP